MNAATARELAKLYEKQAEMCDQAEELQTEIDGLLNGSAPTTASNGRKRMKRTRSAGKPGPKAGSKAGKRRGRPPGSKNKGEAKAEKTGSKAESNGKAETNGTRSKAVNEKSSHVIAYEHIKKNGKAELKDVTKALMDSGWKTKSNKPKAFSAAAFQAINKLRKPAKGPALVGKKGHDYFLTAAGKKAKVA